MVTSTPIYDQDDKVCLVVTNVRDIYELTALQETLDHQRRLSAKYRQEMSVIRAQLMTTPQLVAEDPATLNLLRIVSRPHPGRDGHRQGAHRHLYPPALPPRLQKLHPRQLRGHPGKPG